MEDKGITNTASATAGTEHEDQLGLERLIFFSDAVFAIAITLLALDIRLPELGPTAGDDDMIAALLAIRPQFFGYFISFAVIGLIWIGHHRMYRYVRGYDRLLVLLNLLLLMLVAFIPFPTRLIGVYSNRVVMVLYALTLTATGLVSAVIWLYAAGRGRLLDPAAHGGRGPFNLFFVPAIFVVSAIIALWSTSLARAIWLAVLFFGIVEAIMESRRPRSPALKGPRRGEPEGGESA